jgi:hypothetical protein
MGAKCLANHVLVSLEGKVANKESIRRWVLGVTELLRTVVGTVLWCGVVTGSSKVDVGDTAIDLTVLLGGKSFSCISSVGELNISETLGAAGLPVSHDTSAGKLTELLELAVQPLVINVPAQVTDKQVLDTFARAVSFDLGLLGGSFRL